jgi:hypothetical protein
MEKRKIILETKGCKKESTNKHVACGFNMIFTLNILFILFLVDSGKKELNV